MTNILTALRTAALAGAAVAALALTPGMASANTALQAVGIGASFDGFATDETIGWTFSANQNLSVTRLGWFVSAPNLVSDHQVGIWDDQGALLGSGIVLAPGPASPDGFRYVSTLAAPFTLAAGHNYFIGGRDGLNDGDRYITGLQFVLTDPAITFLGSAHSAAGSGFAFPDVATPGQRGRVGPNFQFEILPDAPPPTAAPEPGAWAMMLLGFGGLGAALRARRRVAATYCP